MSHIVVPSAEAILDREFPVLDRGFVRLVDYLGGDERVVAAARISYGQGTKSETEDKALIAYLMRNRHTSPFEQVEFVFHVKLPIVVARQWIRHRTAHVNEFSARYSVMPDEFYLPSPEAIRYQSRKNRQGRSDEEVGADLIKKVLGLLTTDFGDAYATYRELLNDGIARELARIGLPLSIYTQWYWKIDLHNLFHFLKLRLDEHAQWEIRQYAQVIAKITKCVVPWSFEAFEEYVLHAVTFSRTEIGWLRDLLAGRALEVPPDLQRRYDDFRKKLEED